MKSVALIITAIAATAFASGTAIAACPDTTGSVKNDTQKGISKDGTHAPMENAANSKTQMGAASTGTTTTSTDATKKSGKTTALADQGGRVDKNLATSGQDVQAQQKGDQTAAAQGDASKDCVE